MLLRGPLIRLAARLGAHRLADRLTPTPPVKPLDHWAPEPAHLAEYRRWMREAHGGELGSTVEEFRRHAHWPEP